MSVIILKKERRFLNMKHYLKPLNHNQKSFYKNAYYTITETDTSINYRLYSYDTVVLDIVVCKEDTLLSNYIVNEKTTYSRTTEKHVKEMLLQFLPNYEEIFGTCERVPIRTIMQKGLTEDDIPEIFEVA